MFHKMGLVQQRQEPHTAEGEALLVKELTQLTMKERTGIEEEIHGVADEIIETTEFLHESLEKLQHEIDSIKKKPAYERAMFLSPSYVTSQKFRLLFLRADKFDAIQASRRLVKHFEVKLEIFGLDKLCKDITWDDLEDDDKEAAKTGSIWFTKNKDQAGRTIAWLFPKHERFANYRNQVRWTTTLIA